MAFRVRCAINKQCIEEALAGITPAELFAICPVVIGPGSSASTNGVAVGCGVTATGLNSVALGNQASALSDNSIAIGNLADVPLSTMNESIAIGSGSSITGPAGQSTVVGVNARAQNDACAFGHGAQADGGGSSAFGHDSRATSDRCTALGSDANAGFQSTAVGFAAQATSGNSASLGRGAEANGSNCLALGEGAQANINNTISIGQGTTNLLPATVAFSAPYIYVPGAPIAGGGVPGNLVDPTAPVGFLQVNMQDGTNSFIPYYK